MTLTTKERIACTVLSKLRHNGTDFLDCKYNDILLDFCEKVLKVDPLEVFKKALDNVNRTK